MEDKINYIKETIKDKKRKIKKFVLTVVIGGVVIVGVSVAGFVAYVKSNINYTREEAQQVALTSINGQVVNSRTNIDDGSLRYEFTIKDGNNRLYEVEVDSRYGAITDMEYR